MKISFVLSRFKKLSSDIPIWRRKRRNRRKLCCYSSTSNEISRCCFQKQTNKIPFLGNRRAPIKLITNYHEAKGSGCLSRVDRSTKHLWMATKNEARRLSLQSMVDPNQPKPQEKWKSKNMDFSFITSQNKTRQSTSVTSMTWGKGFHLVNYFTNLQTVLDFAFSRWKVQGHV